MSECRVVNLKELGVSIEVFNKIYSMGEEDGRADAIECYRQALHTQYNQNKALATKCAKGNRAKELALTNIDLEEVDNIAEQLKEQKNDRI